MSRDTSLIQCNMQQQRLLAVWVRGCSTGLTSRRSSCRGSTPAHVNCNFELEPNFTSALVYIHAFTCLRDPNDLTRADPMADTRQSVLITGCAPGGIGHSLACNFHEKGRLGPVYTVSHVLKQPIRRTTRVCHSPKHCSARRSC